MQELPKYHLRRKDFAKIRAWFEFTQQNFIPVQAQSCDASQKEKGKECYFRLFFNEILLSQCYLNRNIKQMFKIKQMVVLSSLFNKEQGCIVSNGREITVQCQFDVNNMVVKLKEEIGLFFYSEAAKTKDYELCFEIHTINQQGQLLKFGACRFPLLQRKDTPKENVLAIFNNLFGDRNQQLELQTLSQVQNARKEKKSPELQELGFVGKIQFELDTEQIKDVKKYLPPLRIIDRHAKLPPTTFNLKKKKQQFALQASYRVLLQDILFKINKPSFFRQQLLDNNPFTLSHKDYVEFELKDFSVLIDNHNGYKFICHRRNQLPLQLVVQNEEEIYVSSKKIHNLELNYFEADLMVLVLILSCRVEFRLKGVTEQKRTSQFMVGWLPIPLELGRKQNKIELMMVNDVEFPTSIVSLLGVPSQVEATFVHNQHQKYKQKKEQKKVYTQHLVSDTIRMSTSTQYLKLKSKRNVTDSRSSQAQSKHQEAIEAKIRAVKSLIAQKQGKREDQKYVKVNGRAELGQPRHQNTSLLPIESTVGKYLKLKLEIDSFIPETNSPSIFYLPRKMKATIYFLRQIRHMPVNITDREARFHIPTRLNPQKSTFYFNSYVNSVEQYQAIMSSRFIVTFYEEDAQRCYAKGITSAHDILGAVEADNYAYVGVCKWSESGYKVMGRLLVNVELEVVKNNRNAVQEMNLNKMLYKMPLEQRMKMRIGCYKGDEAMKNQAVSYLKRKEHSKYIQSVVSDQLRCDGQLQYEVGKDVHYLLAFTNDNSSEINTFTVHLNCPYAELVTDQRQYRQIVQQLNVEQLGYQRLHQVMQQPGYLSYYETKLRFNQQLGLLIRLNVNDFSDKGPLLQQLEVVIKRNTIQVKKYLLKCKYLQPMVYDVIYDCAVCSGEGPVCVPLPAQINANYTHVTFLDNNVSYKSKNKQITIARPRKLMKLLASVQCLGSQQRKTLIYQILVIPGQQLTLATGEPHKIILPLPEKAPVQILTCSQPEVTITNVAKFNIRDYNSEQDLVLHPLRPFSLKNYVICYYDLSGVRLGEYLLRVESQLRFISSKLDIVYDQSSTYTVVMNNPYACACNFTLASSNRGVMLQEQEITIEGYGSRVLIFELSEWAWDEKSIFLFMLDEKGNVCQAVEVSCKIPIIKLQQEDHID